MISKESQISLTYTLGGECLVRKGQYTSADVYVKFPFTKNEVFKINKPSKTIVHAEYEKAVQQVTLSNSFVQTALDKPEKPNDMSWNRWLRTPIGKLYQDWKKLSDEQKIAFHVNQYVIDMNGEDYSYEII